MITVYQEMDENRQGPWGPTDLWFNVVVDHPEVNCTYYTEAQTHQCLLESWNRTFPDDPKTAADFEYVTPPADWFNPLR